jgi:GMP reductase
MISKKKTLLDFDNLLIEPASITDINSRSEVNIYDENGNLPLMTAPMDTVIGEENFHHFQQNKIIPVLPRKDNEGKKQQLIGMNFQSYSLTNFRKLFLDVDPLESTHYVLIDVANGHMKTLLETCEESKYIHGDNLVLMVGNIANPQTFVDFGMVGVDYIRVGIGNGNGCLTSVQTGVGYPMASLIDEIYTLKRSFKLGSKIVADGGFKKYSDIIKSLALGSDYVMLGSIFNATTKRKYPMISENNRVVDQYSPEIRDYFMSNGELEKEFRGMSTKGAQKSMGKKVLKTSEGVEKTQKVEYTLGQWVENFEDYLRSAMSYTGNYDLKHFKNNTKLNIISNSSFKRLNK